MKSARLLMTIVVFVLLIPVLLFTIGCSQEEHTQRVEGEAAIGETAENAAAEESEHAPGETKELASNEAGESSRGEGIEGSHEGEGRHARGEGRGEEGGEHGEEGHGEEGEESGARYTQDDTVVEVRRGIELNLKYDKTSSTFIGTVKNVSNQTASRVRVEVHLSNGVELGPTTPIDLAPGQQADVKLSAKNQTFTWWSTHAEIGG